MLLLEFKKKLVALSKENDCEAIQPWIRSIVITSTEYLPRPQVAMVSSCLKNGNPLSIMSKTSINMMARCTQSVLMEPWGEENDKRNGAPLVSLILNISSI